MENWNSFPINCIFTEMISTWSNKSENERKKIYSRKYSTMLSSIFVERIELIESIESIVTNCTTSNTITQYITLISRKKETLSSYSVCCFVNDTPFSHTPYNCINNTWCVTRHKITIFNKIQSIWCLKASVSVSRFWWSDT